MMEPEETVVEEAPAEEAAPALTITQPAEPQITYAEMIRDYNFTEQERKAIDACAAQFDIMDNNQILQFGVGCQKRLTDFSDSALNSVRTKDLGQVGDMLSSCVRELKSFDAEEDKKGILGVFKKSQDKIEVMKLRYAKAETNVNKITNALEDHQVTLMKDISVLDQMYELNKQYFRELSMYIAAGKKKLEEMRSKDLPELLAKAQASGLQEDAQAVRDLDSQCNRFEKKLHDLELTRAISLQMAPQLRMIQSNDTQMVEKIQSTIVNTIPLWKSQMVISLGLQHSLQAAKAQNAATELTNELLKKNAKALKTASIETAKASERGIVDMETLRATNESLISTLDEVMAIQKEGHEKRMVAEQEMVEIETELKKKLLEINITK
ncbi:MAG: toxic anion resistance protein [Dorea sp.]|nr:toxic anion resistance protein [Dorea sp.]